MIQSRILYNLVLYKSRHSCTCAEVKLSGKQLHVHVVAAVTINKNGKNGL